MSVPLLTTKYHLPPWVPDRVQRSRLLTRLDQVLLPGMRLALVSAPAGSGKTTLVREWIEHAASSDPGDRRGLRFAWLSADEEDNDPAVFLST